MSERPFKRGICPAFFISLLLSVPVHAENGVTSEQWWVSLESLSYSEPQPVHNALMRWGETFDQGTRQWTFNRLELGWHNGRWGIALLQRADYRVNLSEDGVTFWGAIERREPLETGRRYEVTAEASGYTGTGVRLIKPFHTASWGRGSVSLTGWRINRVLDGTLTGWARATSQTEYDYQADVDYFYTEDPLFGRQDLDRAVGWGYGIDAEWIWQSADWTVQADLRDLLGRIVWRDVPYTRATSTSARREYDANGYLLLNPAISGVEGYRNVTQHLDTQVRLQVRRALADQGFFVSADAAWLADHLWGAMGAGVEAVPGTSWSARWWPEMRRVDVGYHRPDWSVTLGLDSLNVRSARAVRLNLAWKAGSSVN